jgi:hypothetical protein
MSKFTVDRFHDLRSGRYCWRRCLLSELLHRRDVSSWHCVVSLLICALEHPDALKCQVTEVTHMLVAIGCVCSDVSRGGHDRSLLGFGQ